MFKEDIIIIVFLIILLGLLIGLYFYIYRYKLQSERSRLPIYVSNSATQAEGHSVRFNIPEDNSYQLLPLAPPSHTPPPPPLPVNPYYEQENFYETPRELEHQEREESPTELVDSPDTPNSHRISTIEATNEVLVERISHLESVVHKLKQK